MLPDLEKTRRETLRWVCLQVTHAGEPIGVSEQLLNNTVNGVLPNITPRELRLALDYLCERELIEISDRQTPNWFIKLTRCGFDVVEYTVECEPGIARPQKYWG